MLTDNLVTNPREFMELSVDTMRNSIGENRSDKSSPLVGAVIVISDGRVEKAYRGELSDGDHAEYTLLERKLSSENLSGAILFSTLEPCAPGARSETKLSCAERIVNRRIAKVWVGIEDPDPLVNGRGIQYLQEHGVTVDIFDRELQESIRQLNMEFIKGAEDRASRFEERPIQKDLSQLESPILSAALDDLDADEMVKFIERTAGLRYEFGSVEFIRVFDQLKYIAKVDADIYPTGLGILLFGKNPQIFFPNAVIRATYRTAGRKEDIATFSGSLPKQAQESLEWFKRIIGKQGDRSSAERKEAYYYPIDVIRESLNNALAHCSYEIEGASIYLEVNDDVIIIRSPGGPVKPISMERIQRLDAPYLSKNPKITFAFEKLNLCESRGLGFETIRSLPAEHKLPLPTVTFDNPYLIFEFSRAYGNGASADNRLSMLSSAELKGYDYIRLNSPVTRMAYEEHFGVAGITANRHIARLLELGLITRLGAGKKISYEVV